MKIRLVVLELLLTFGKKDKQKLEWCSTHVDTLENSDCVWRQEESNKKKTTLITV